MIRGPDLDPDLISKRLGLEGTKMHMRGLPRPKSPTIISKTGLWSLESKSAANEVAEHVQDILDKLNGVDECVASIDGVEDAYMDIFFSERDEDDNKVGASFFLDPKQVSRISFLGLAVQVST